MRSRAPTAEVKRSDRVSGWQIRVGRGVVTFPMKSATARRVRYAQGYAELGLFREAENELDGIEPTECANPGVLVVRVTLHWEAKQWEQLVAFAGALARAAPQEEKGWIAWAFALRELGRIADARAVLLEAEPIHGRTSAVLHYNLGCYHCLLGEFEAARKRLHTAFRLHPPFKAEAGQDRDLEAMWAEFEA